MIDFSHTVAGEAGGATKGVKMIQAEVRSIPLFSRISRRETRLVAGLMDEFDVAAGATLTRQGDYAREFFVIESGQAEVVRDGRPAAALGPGDFFGELGLIDGPTRNATVVASTPMRVLVAGRVDFATLVHGVPSVGARVREVAASRR